MSIEIKEWLDEKKDPDADHDAEFNETCSCHFDIILAVDMLKLAVETLDSISREATEVIGKIEKMIGGGL